MMMLNTSKSDCYSFRQSYELPAGRTVAFAFAAPDQWGYEITPPATGFGGHGDVMDFLGAYVAARRDFLQIVATLTGLRLAVIDDLPNGDIEVGETIAPALKQ